MMLLMLRLFLKISFVSIVSTTLFADDSVELLEEYLTNQIENNPVVKEGDAKVIDQKELKEIPGWSAYIIDIHATLKRGNKKIHQKNIFFSNGRYITGELTDMRTGDSLKDKIKPKFDPKYYKDENLISGSKNSKHKVAIFSDPLCPFCRQYVPRALRDMMAEPEKFAIYYYHLPLPNIHPASVILVKAEIAAELKGHKADIMKLYTKIQPTKPNKPYYVAYREKNVKKILKVFNEVMGTNLTPKDLKSKAVLERFKADQKIAEDLMVSGTPTVYFDGEYDRTKQQYKKAE